MKNTSTPCPIPLVSLIPSRWQPRTSFDAARLLTLAQSIRDHGLAVPVTVFLCLECGHELLAGERRVRAMVAGICATQTAGQDLAAWVQRAASATFWAELEANRFGYLELLADAFITALVLPGDDLRALHELVLVENLQREDLTPLERAQAVNDLLTAGDYTQSQVAQRLGVSQPSISQWLALLDVVPAVQQRIIDRSISPTAAQAIARVPEPAQAALAQRVQEMVDAGDDEAATKRKIQKLSREVRKFLDPARYQVPEGLAVDPPCRNLLRLLHYAIARLPEERVGPVVQQLTAEDNIRLLRQNPVNLRDYNVSYLLRILRSEDRDGLGSIWEQVATTEGWTCGTCQLRPLEDLEISSENLYPYCRRCRKGEAHQGQRGRADAAPVAERVTCDRYVGPHDPLVIPLEYQTRGYWPADLEEFIQHGDDCGDYVTSVEDYRRGFQLATAAAARRVQEQAQAKRQAHLSAMATYQELQRRPDIDLLHFQAHACERCAHYDPDGPVEGLSCRYAAEPLRKQYGNQATRAPQYHILVRRDGLMVPRCEMFRWREVPELVNGTRGWRFPDREAVLAWLYEMWDEGRYSSSSLNDYAVLSWLPYPRARDQSSDQMKLIQYLREEWDALGGDDALANLLTIALTECNAARASYSTRIDELLTPAGELEEWSMVTASGLQYNSRPGQYPDDWPTPWIEEPPDETRPG